MAYIKTGYLKNNAGALLTTIPFPIGAIYMSVSDTDPSELFGGTWERINGRFLLGTGRPSDNTDNYFGALNGTYSAGVSSKGGQAYHTLTSSESGQKNLGSITTGNESQSHTHTITTGGYTYPNGSSPGAFSTATSDSTLTKDTYGYTYMTSESANHTHSFSIGGQNASSSHNNMPPYFAVNMWKRTA